MQENRGNNLDDELELENTSNKIVMGLAHRCHLHWGVQFHPESIGTKYGGQILSNFRKATAQFHNKKSYAGSLSLMILACLIICLQKFGEG